MPLRHSLSRVLRIVRPRLQDRFVFVHINKTGGSSIEKALGLRFEHKTALEKVEELGRSTWDARFTFSFVRSPWDKVVSHYAYRLKTNQTGLAESRMSFPDWVAAAYRDRDPRYYDIPKMFMPQVDWISGPDGSVLVDFVGRFETLATDFAKVCSTLGIKAPLPHTNASPRGPYREYYDATSREIVASAFAADLDAFGYVF
jgi:hypothetical protein